MNHPISCFCYQTYSYKLIVEICKKFLQKHPRCFTEEIKFEVGDFELEEHKTCYNLFLCLIILHLFIRKVSLCSHLNL